MKLPIRLFVYCVCVLVSAPAGAAPGPREPVELSRRYITPLQGFSLRPPAGTDRVKDISPSILVSWQKRHPASGAIVWTLSVQSQPTQADVNTVAYSAALAQRLRQNNFQVDSLKLGYIAGKDTILIAGKSSGIIPRYEKQAWIRAEATRFLILVISGPPDMADRLADIFDAVGPTLELIDRADAVLARQEQITRAAKLLADLTDQKLEAVVHTQPQWFLLQMDGQTVGFMKVVEAKVERPRSRGATVRGVAVSQWLMMQLPNDRRRLVRREAFTSADRKSEHWKETLQIGQDQSAVVLTEEGLRQQDLIVCTRTTPGREKTYKKPIPDTISVIYLPRAMGHLLSRLVDVGRADSYGFGAYASDSNEFDLRGLTVIGPETIELADEHLGAIAMTDQKAADQEPAKIWVDQEGLLVLMKTADGLSMQRATVQQVRRQFRDAEDLIHTLDKAAANR